jgi:integrase
VDETCKIESGCVNCHARPERLNMSVYVRKYKGTKHYHYDFTLRGKRHRGPIPEARTRSQAEQAEIVIRNEKFENRFGTGKIPRFSDFFLQTYLPWAKANKRSAREDESKGKPLVEHFGNRKMDEITLEDVERFRNKRRTIKTWRGDARSPKTVNLEVQHLSRIFSFAIERGVQVENPCKRVKKLQADSRRTRHLSHDEEERLMPWLNGRRAHLRPIVLLAIHTGMRQGEIMQLRWPDIDFQRNVINVVHGGSQSTKTGKGRTIPLNSIARDVLLEMERKGDRVFSIACPKRSFAFACKKAGIEDFRFHDLRHTFATRAGDAGATAFEIAALLGHSAVTMTAIYTHATSDGIRRAVEGLTRENGSAMSRFGQKEAAAS